MKTLLCALALVGFLTVSYADHDATCKNPHGKVTVVTADLISVDDKPYKIGKSTRILRGDKVVPIATIKAGDTVCVDTRGKDDIGDGEIVSVTILAPATTPVTTAVVQEKEVTKVSYHDKNCPHTHARVTRDGDILIVNGQPLVASEHVIVKKGEQAVTVQSLKSGDIVCLHDENRADVKEKITTVYVLDPSESYLVPETKVIEREKIQIR